MHHQSSYGPQLDHRPAAAAGDDAVNAQYIAVGSGGRWVVEDSAIVGSQDKPGNGGIIITDKNYGDFEVIVEMKNDYGPDSGLFLRSNERGQAYQALIDYHGGGDFTKQFVRYRKIRVKVLD